MVKMSAVDAGVVDAIESQIRSGMGERGVVGGVVIETGEE